ncbi:ABC transporter ATP-binding protein [Candidatus Uabimicrobium amorphum]|uniref:Nitrate/sulfonate/bicarbonate ABC transporterATP-binding protein n=1 Tax=Uabimicrobium amorphum TaxID=2596890 RepID=A0A5S9ILA7_UABAM|nr:ABC transporter ATP-binding protein [Candidatus Uabimicrobium amorphum]BBM83607.1 nitrate/sulfonate/bicarbonate ABC transporterATP-binding protein [Candidatus Uabimicrobium amorphum]
MYYENNVQALQDIDFCVTQGEFVSIVGPSGCGKSTLIRIIAGLIDNYVGDVRVAEMTKTDEQPLALVFQEANLLPWRKTLDNVRLPLELAEVCENVQKEKSLAALDIVRLKDFAHAYPRELSGGMKMRVSLARALVTKPQLMLLDEPFSALDEITRQQLNEDLLRLWQQDQWTALFVTHNISEAVFLSSRIIVMSDRPGRIIADVAIPFSYPRTPQLRSSVEFAQHVGKISSLLREGTYE